MSANAVIQAFHELKNALLGLVSALKADSPGTLAFQSREEALHNGILVTVTHPTHAELDSERSEAREIAGGRVGTSLIGMDQQFRGRLTMEQRHLQGGTHESLIVMWSHGPTHHQAREEIQD